MSEELKPCPFCGGEPEIVECDYGMYFTGYAVYCRQCSVKVGVTGRLGEAYEWVPIFSTEADAIASWNTRCERTCKVELTPDNDGWCEWRCSVCASNHVDAYDKFCPNCGSRVVEE